MRAGELIKRSPLPPCDQCSVLQLGGCECAGLPLSRTCRPSVTAMRQPGAVPPRSLLPPGGGQPCSRSYSRGGEREGSRKKRLNWQILLAAPRTRAVVDVSCHHFTVVALSSAMKVQDRWKDSVVVCKYKVRLRCVSAFFQRYL
ncbi:uncharacterized protein ACIBXB_017373 [Morphnus guianensis]